MNTTLQKLFHVYMNDHSNPNEELVPKEKLIRFGIVCKDDVPVSIANELVRLYGVDLRSWTRTFHSSWEKVAFTPMEQLVAEQLIHYLSTYGLESVGLPALPYIPREQVCDNAEVFPNIKAFTVFREVSEEEAEQLIRDYLAKTLAPHPAYSLDLRAAIESWKIPADEIASFEYKVIAWQDQNVVPTRAKDIMRFVIYLLTYRTLIINSKPVIRELEYCTCTSTNSKLVNKILSDEAAQKELSKFFFNYKPMLLAIKKNRLTSKEAKHGINRMRKMADANHIKANMRSIKNVLWLAQNDTDGLDEVLAKATNRELVAVANYLATTDDSNQMYSIRNGSSFVRLDRTFDAEAVAYSAKQVAKELAKRYKGKFEGKTFLIPSYVSYAAPISEKQMMGNIPYGSSVEVKGAVAGIYWENYKNCCTDIDLHTNNAFASIGWNSGYRSGDVLYSGDLTDATHGAVEAMYYRGESDGYALSVNNFTAEPYVPFKFLISTHEGWGKGNSMMCVENALFPPVPLTFDERTEMQLGLFQNRRFYFYGGSLGCDRVPNQELKQASVQAMVNKLTSMLSIDYLLNIGNANIITDAEYANLDEESKKAVVNLSPGALTARTLFDLVD